MSAMNRITVEEGLKRVEDRAAMLRFFADSIRDVDIAPDPAVFSGLGDAAREIEDTVRAARRALDVDALGTEFRP
jgi:hypothetical protein